MSLDPPLVPITAEQIWQKQVQRLLLQLRDANNMRDAYFEVLTNTIMRMHWMEAHLQDAQNEIDRLNSHWSLVDDIARSDVKPARKKNENDDDD